MKILFKLSVLLGILTILGGCSDPDSKPRPFITSFTIPQGLAVKYAVEGRVRFSFTGPSCSSGGMYEILTESYGDTNLRMSFSTTGPGYALTSGLEAIRVATISDFNQNYPAGSDVTDLLSCFFRSYLYFIQHNYTPPSQDNEPNITDFWGGYAGMVIMKDAIDVDSEVSALSHPDCWLLAFNEQPAVPGKYKFKLSVNIENRNLTTEFEMDF